MNILSTYPEIASEYQVFAAEGSTESSRKAPSYVRAIDILNAVLKNNCPEMLGHSHNLWLLTDPEKIEEIRKFVLTETKKPNGGIFKDVEQKSYWKNNYCSAALRVLVPFQQYMVKRTGMIGIVEQTDNPGILANRLEAYSMSVDVDAKDEFGISLNNLTGKDKLVVQKAREGQQKFRTLVLWNYENQCCISGLPVIQSLQASHISDWSENPAMRLNATNGLCLAAHYHLAFDNHLITLDEQYRLVISKTLRDYYTNDAFKEQFLKYEGKAIRSAKKFKPSLELLAEHREQLVG